MVHRRLYGYGAGTVRYAYCRHDFLRLLGQYVFTENNAIGRLLVLAGRLASLLMGAGIGAGIAHHLKMPPLVVFSTIVAGFIGAWANVFIKAGADANVVVTLVQGLVKPSGATMPGNPIGSYVAALMACEIANLVAGKTKLRYYHYPRGIALRNHYSGVRRIPVYLDNRYAR